jgi:hypothetical protein
MNSPFLNSPTLLLAGLLGWLLFLAILIAFNLFPS